MWEKDLRDHAEYLRSDALLTTQTYLSQTGLIVTGDEGLDRAVEWYIAPRVRDFKTGVFFRLRVEQYFRQVRRWLDNYSVQITANPWSEYLLSDVPVVAINAERSTGAIRREAGLAHAEQYFMPLSPYLTVALNHLGDRWRISTESEAQVLNTLQIVQARSSIYFQPQSSLLDFARELLSLRKRWESDSVEATGQ